MAWVGVMIAALLALPASRAAAASATPAPAWQVTTAGVPTILTPETGTRGKYDVVVENVGGVPSEGGAVLRDKLPAGLTVQRVAGEPFETVECGVENGDEVVCTDFEGVVPSGFFVANIYYEVSGSLVAGTALRNTVKVGGGGAVEVSSTDATIGVRREGEKGPGPAGIADFGFSATGAAGEAVSQAGGHPNLVTTWVLFNNMFLTNPTSRLALPVEAPKDLAFYLPLGMLGNPAVTSPCPPALVETEQGRSGCPPGSRIGSVIPMILNNVFASNKEEPTHVRALYAITPEKGYAAEIAFTSNNIEFVAYASVVRHDGTYMVRVAIPGVPTIAGLIGFVASFYGDIQEHYFSGEEAITFDRGAFLTNPTDCTEGAQAREASVVMNTWTHPHPLSSAEATPGDYAFAPAFANLEGCGLLSFSAGLSVTPETTQADSPSGYEMGLEVPQAPNNGAGLATPPVKDVSLSLPVGTAISPSSANGLEACAETGHTGIDIEGPESEEIAADGLERPAPGHCPAASQIATVRASTPLLHEELTGHLFVATPKCGSREQGCTTEDAEDGKLFGLYLELEAPNSGVIVKLEGRASVRADTGQITASFDDAPQFPFSRLTVSTRRGARAPLANSQVCGTAASSALVRPWGSPATADAGANAAFHVDWNGGGANCPASYPFAPTFSAGTTSPVAASTSPFTLILKREDREQNIGTLSTTLPEGLLADLSKVARCPEPAASQKSLNACPAGSQIGTTTVAVGSGSDPYYVTGKVFFTGPYGGAPFGLSVVVPAVAGPFNLGNELVRAKLFVDPHTSQVTAVSDPLPQMLDGVPLRMRLVNIMLENKEFVLNPTNCTKTSITGTVISSTGGSAGISSPFAVAGCKNLSFKPTVSISTEANATKANGTGVTAKIAYPTGGQANVAKVVVGFPKQLPVRLETLQQACRAVVFEANPARCPAASDIGTATAHTPILAQPLTGPVYLVSYGNAKFPDVVFVLQGEGITLEVDGQSFVSKAGALRVTFASVPDAPFSSFAAVLPPGRYSQFTSAKTVGRERGSQCGENLLAPVHLTAQNGAQIVQNVTLKINGCPPSVSIAKATRSGRTLSVTVVTNARGRLRIAGAGLKTLAVSNLRAGKHKLKVALTRAGRAAARAHRRIKLTVVLAAGKRTATTHKKIAL